MTVACLPDYVGIGILSVTLVVLVVTLVANHHTHRAVQEMRRNSDRAVRLMRSK